MFDKANAAHTKVSEKVMVEILGRSPNLTKVSFGMKTMFHVDRRPITKLLASALTSFPSLKELSLQQCGIDDDIVTIICQKLKELKKLELYSGKLTSQGCKSIAQLSGLTHLHIRKVFIGCSEQSTDWWWAWDSGKGAVSAHLHSHRIHSSRDQRSVDAPREQPELERDGYKMRKIEYRSCAVHRWIKEFAQALCK